MKKLLYCLVLLILLCIIINLSLVIYLAPLELMFKFLAFIQVTLLSQIIFIFSVQFLFVIGANHKLLNSKTFFIVLVFLESLISICTSIMLLALQLSQYNFSDDQSASHQIEPARKISWYNALNIYITFFHIQNALSLIKCSILSFHLEDFKIKKNSKQFRLISDSSSEGQKDQVNLNFNNNINSNIRINIDTHTEKIINFKKVTVKTGRKTSHMNNYENTLPSGNRYIFLNRICLNSNRYSRISNLNQSDSQISNSFQIRRVKENQL